MASRAHTALTEKACREYGDYGPQISGCMRDHFPQELKKRLVRLARAVTRHNQFGCDARPRFVRHSTMRELARSICRVNGTGFYGFLI